MSMLNSSLSSLALLDSQSRWSDLLKQVPPSGSTNPHEESLSWPRFQSSLLFLKMCLLQYVRLIPTSTLTNLLTLRCAPDKSTLALFVGILSIYGHVWTAWPNVNYRFSVTSSWTLEQDWKSVWRRTICQIAWIYFAASSKSNICLQQGFKGLHNKRRKQNVSSALSRLPIFLIVSDLGKLRWETNSLDFQQDKYLVGRSVTPTTQINKNSRGSCSWVFQMVCTLRETDRGYEMYTTCGEPYQQWILMSIATSCLTLKKQKQ